MSVHVFRAWGSTDAVRFCEQWKFLLFKEYFSTVFPKNGLVFLSSTHNKSNRAEAMI